jgi:hypothetical protein
MLKAGDKVIFDSKYIHNLEPIMLFEDDVQGIGIILNPYYKNHAFFGQCALIKWGHESEVWVPVKWLNPAKPKGHPLTPIFKDIA